MADSHDEAEWRAEFERFGVWGRRNSVSRFQLRGRTAKLWAHTNEKG
jgi:hypothetical protein